ncbi:hypothetical protein [Chitinophaga sp. Cy-1792]|uniref:hypothetical protein n=1 Tax=Chitinophaga sp. Cy-1792 TaxID=2608339 RepID=UPI0014203B62|nr:hypothetical protein [Chitinophaga sp. Cy-1792]NIG54453.1 hypothetical protein [Chitinophaga sp. Cy-1792]
MEKKIIKVKNKYTQQVITYTVDEKLNNLDDDFPAAKLEATEKALPKLRELIKSFQQEKR